MPAITKVRGAYLPHWRAEGASYFVTFRLAGSLPGILKYNREARQKDILQRVKKAGRKFTPWEISELANLRIEERRHQRHDLGNRYLKDPRIAKVVADAFMHFQEKRYRLFAWVIMPTHVHIVFQPLNGHDVPDILHSWKRFSAREANKILGQKGEFWHPEYYDHLIDDENDLLRCIEYTWSNPDQANLKNWKWRWRGPVPANFTA